MNWEDLNWRCAMNLFCKARKREAFNIKVRDIFEMNRKIYGSRRISIG